MLFIHTGALPGLQYVTRDVNSLQDQVNNNSVKNIRNIFKQYVPQVQAKSVASRFSVNIGYFVFYQDVFVCDATQVHAGLSVADVLGGTKTGATSTYFIAPLN